MIDILKNSWVEKVKEKIKPKTASAYESCDIDSWAPPDLKKKVKRHSMATKTFMNRTLRGVRK